MDILKQFSHGQPADTYLFGRVTAVSGIQLTVVTSTGFQINVTDSDRTYGVGDQLILGKNGNLNSLFIIRKVNNLFPASGGNIMVSTGQG